MQKSNSRYFVLLVLALMFSIPFYIWAAFFPVEGLPFGLPISFLMIFVPFLLSLIYAWIVNGKKEIILLDNYKKYESESRSFPDHSSHRKPTA